MKKLLLVVVTGVALLLTGCSSDISNDVNEIIITLDVFGMVCGSCEDRLTDVLEEAGATVINISATNNSVEFEFDEGVISLVDIQIAIVEAGFQLDRSNFTR